LPLSPGLRVINHFFHSSQSWCEPHPETNEINQKLLRMFHGAVFSKRAPLVAEGFLISW
jgi:hypothetical protein